MASSKDVASGTLFQSVVGLYGVGVPTTHAGALVGYSPLNTRVRLQRSQTLEGGAGVAGKLGINKSLISVLSRQGIFIRCQKNGLLLGGCAWVAHSETRMLLFPHHHADRGDAHPPMGDGPSFGTYL